MRAQSFKRPIIPPEHKLLYSKSGFTSVSSGEVLTNNKHKWCTCLIHICINYYINYIYTSPGFTLELRPAPCDMTHGCDGSLNDPSHRELVRHLTHHFLVAVRQLSLLSAYATPFYNSFLMKEMAQKKKKFTDMMKTFILFKKHTKSICCFKGGNSQFVAQN